MARFGRLLLVWIMVVALGLLPAGPASATTPPEAVNDAVAYAADQSVTSFISVVDRSTGNITAQTGNAQHQVASESIMKLLLATYYLVLYGGHAATPDSVKDRLAYMLKVSDDGNASSLFSANAIPTVAARYDLSNTTNATDRVGHWGAARITAADMTRFLYEASKDAAVGPWLIPVMSETAPYGSDGFDQDYGLNALDGDHGSKQGWGCDSFWTNPKCAIHSVGYTERSFVAVLQLSNGYPDPMRATATYAAQVIAQSRVKPDPIGSLDVVNNPATKTLTLAGWAADPDAPGQRVEAHVYVTGPNGTRGYPGIFTDGSRPDVAGVFPWAGGSTGFSATVDSQGAGNNTVCVYALNVNPPRTNPIVGCRTIDVRNAFGHLDRVGTGSGEFTAAGWALNPNNAGENVEIHLYDAGPSGTRGDAGFRANTQRTDVGAAFGGYGDNHGFSATIPSMDVGTHDVCAWAITTAGGDGNSLLGCTAVEVRRAFGSLDLVTTESGTIVAAGWALNPNSPSEHTEIHVYDTSAAGTLGYPGFRAAGSRPDVGAAFAGFGSDHGFWAAIPSGTAGVHTVCAYAITTGAPNGSANLGCKQITVG